MPSEPRSSPVPLREKDREEIILRLLSIVQAACDGETDLVAHNVDRCLQLLGHCGLAPPPAPLSPPAAVAFLAALDPAAFLDSALDPIGEALHEC